MAKKRKVRGNRWDEREHLKLLSNRMGRLDAEHPQARRQLERFAEQLLEESEDIDPKIKKIVDDNFWDLI